MSQWTHVNASIRIDSIRMIGMTEPKPGNRELWSEDKETKYDFDLPGGSEGTLDYHLWVNPSNSAMAAYTLNIFGDLRSFGKEDVPEILEYLNNVIENQMIRSGIVEINIEYGDTIILIYDDLKGEWVEVYRK